MKDFGALGNGEAKDTVAIQEAIDAANRAGGGTVYFPPGTYLSGTLYLKSRVTLHIDFAATLLGSPDLGDYPVNRCAFRSYTDKYVCQALLWGEDLHDIAIVGQGVIDGQGAEFKDLPWLQRPYIVRFVTCRNVQVEGVTLRSSPMWMQHYLNCDFVTVRGIKVYNHCNRNNDMIDIDCCRDVIISDCFADSDDDALTLKSTADRPTENVAVSNCLLSSHCNAIKMGTESNGGFKNISIMNCAIRPSRSPSVISGRKEGLAGIALELVDGGTLDGITISNVTTVGGTAPIFLRLGNRARVFKPDFPKPSIGTFRNVVISNVVAKEAGTTGCSITGLPGHPIENVTLSNIKITTVGGGTKEDTARSIPELPTKYPESVMFGTLPAYGIFCRHVDGLTLREVDLRHAACDDRPALVCDDVRNLSLESFRAQTSGDAPAQIVLNDTRGGFVRGCCPPETAAAFLRVQGKSDRLNVVANDLSHVQTPFSFDDQALRSALYTAANRTSE